MAGDVVISASQVINAGQGYTVPAAQEITVLAVRASFNGSGAAGAFIPMLQIVGDSGIITAECPAGATVAAGASADVSWFPGVKPTAQASGIRYDVINTGDWFELGTTGANPSNSVGILLYATALMQLFSDTEITLGALELLLSSSGGGISIDAGHVGDNLTLTVSNANGSYLLIRGLPTVAPITPGAVWNNSGVLSIV